MTENERILEYLETAYSGAKMMDDIELMIRLNRAIVAFNCDEFKSTPSWDEMLEEYIAKDIAKPKA